MTILLAAVNAKYIHSNPGIYSLKAYAQTVNGADCPDIELAEYTINHQPEQVLKDLYRRRPQVIGFSCYIWNITFIRGLTGDLAKILPETEIWLGGPEVSFNCQEMLEELPGVRGIMKGEGEEIFARLARAYGDSWGGRTPETNRSGDAAGNLPAVPDTSLAAIPGLCFRLPDGTFADTPQNPVMDLSALPFYYGQMGLDGLEHRIVYYESSRGCPFSCSYCLSSVDKALRFRDLELVKAELDYFLERKVPQVKFVDRTFNCKKSHAMAVWRHILERDNGITNFHFEIAADLLDEEQMALLKQMRPGLIQLEIGVQTTNPRTLEEIHRKTDIGRIGDLTARINSWHNIHQHLDLIAGLPYEGIGRFRQSFNQVYAMEPEQLQLGFLKVLKGSHMAQMQNEYGLCCSCLPPYEVLSTRWITYGELLELKDVEEMLEVHFNSRQFVHTLAMFCGEFSTPYDMFLHMAGYYRSRGLTGISHSRIARYDIFWEMIMALDLDEMRLEMYRDLLMYDLYLRENVKSRPVFARDQSRFKGRVRELFQAEAASPVYLTGYEGYDSRQMSKMAHAEGMGDGSLVLFDYRARDPLSHNAAAYRIP